MPRTLKLAAVQMDAAPTGVSQRLNRAAAIIADAVSAGAQLIALPEVFNTGYEYSDQNYALAETMDGETVHWMKAQAAQHNVHLAGTLLLLDGNEVYNSQLLVAPDGRTWRYDKNYPWAWERAYFREGHGVTIADTDLGKFGMMICWDYSHPELWKSYAGRVDAMLMTSCPPRITAPKITFPDGVTFDSQDFQSPKTHIGGDEPFGQDLDAMTAWMNVPLVNSTGAGTFTSKIPAAKMTLSGLLASRPEVLKQYFSQLDEACLTADYHLQAKVVDANGNVLSRVTTTGDGFTVAEVELADTPPLPDAAPLKTAYPFFAYLMSDTFVPAVVTSLYRQGLRRQFGQHMAPVDSRTKTWVAALLVMFGLGFLIGRTK